MTRLVVFLFGLFFATALPALTINVRSGEQDGFTRLVFDIPSGTGWDIQQDVDEGRVRVRIDRENALFEISRVFDRIPRDRVTDLRPVEGMSELDIMLGCRCVADSFVLRDTMLVVDVRAGVPPEKTTELENSSLVAPQPILSPDVPSVDLSTVLWQGGSGAVDSFPGLAPLAPLQEEQSIDMTQDEITDFANTLVLDLASAANNGILDPSFGQLAPSDPVVQPQVNSETTPAPEAFSDNNESIVQSLRNGLNGLNQDDRKDAQILIGGAKCIAEDRLRIEDWSQENIFETLTSARSELFGEFDRVNTKAVKDQARSLIFLGFGAEARSVLSLDGSRADPVLVALSHLIDGERDPQEIFRSQLHCGPRAKLWALLASTFQNQRLAVEAAPIMIAFESLPDHLRIHLGPLLAEGFRHNGMMEASRETLARTERVTGSQTSRTALEKAKTSLAEGEAKEAQLILENLVKDGVPETSEALISMIGLAFETGGNIDERSLELVGAFAAERRGSEDGAQLWQAHLQALLLANRIDEARGVLENASGVSDAIRQAATEDFFRHLSGVPDDLTFLKHALAENRPDMTPRRQISRRLSERMLRLGLPEATLVELDRFPDSGRHEDLRLLRARALMQLYRPEEAEIVLLGLQNSEVDRLRAEIRSAMGDHDFAISAYDDLGDTEAATTAAWLAGDWANLSNTDDERFSSVAALLAQSAPTEFEDVPSLAEVESLSQNSEASRDALRTLLDATRLTGED